MKPLAGLIVSVVTAVTAAVLIAGCGGSSSQQAANTTTVRAQAARAVPPIPKFLGADSVHPTGTVRARPAQAGTIDDEVNSSGAKQLDPCTLVSRSEVQAIAGRPIAAPVDAPQGPTCIYRPKDGKLLITLAVQDNNFSKVEPQAQLRDKTPVSVRGHAAYCGLTGAPTLIVPLTNGRFLSVTAPCPIAAALASTALTRLSAS
jgi:hypothetical protein